MPGRVALGSDRRAHVVLRGAGGFATVDLNSGEVTNRVPLCPEPRGIAYDSQDVSLYVACAGGTLFHVSEAGEELERYELEPDLRDVVLFDNDVMVSVFRSAELIGLSGTRIKIPEIDGFQPHVAWRTTVNAQGQLEIVHQMQDTNSVPIDPDPDEMPDGGGAYGGGGFCEPGLVNVAVSTITSGPSKPDVQTVMMLGGNLTVDIASAPDGEMIALAVPGASAPEPPQDQGFKNDRGFGGADIAFEEFPSSSRTFSVQGRFDECGSFFFEPNEESEGQVTAVAYQPDGTLVMLSREPAQLLLVDDPFSGSFRTIKLEGEARFDTGHEIFHRATDSGLSCATCHPEGTDDGHVWNFTELGPRRTQPLDVGLEDTAPFHWDGDMGDLNQIMGEVLAHRMGGKRQSEPRQASFSRWMFDLQRPPADNGTQDAATVAAGEQLFASYNCTKCHYGEALGGTQTETIRGVLKQVPTLRRISLHPPFMHDGRSPTLEHAIQDMIQSTENTTAPAEDVDAIAAYLRTL